MKEELNIYKAIVIFLSKGADEQIAFCSDTPNDVGSFRGLSVQQTSLFRFISGSRWYFDYSNTHGDSDDSLQCVEDYLSWLLHTIIKGPEIREWTVQGLKKEDSWGLIRKLANEILTLKEWGDREIGYSFKELLKLTDVWEDGAEE